jgi:hypothetical protein
MRNSTIALLGTVVVSGAALVVACSSSSSTGGSSGSSGSSSGSSGGDAGDAGSSGSSGGGDSGSEGGGGGGYGTPCKTAGGADPACTGTYNLCEAVGADTICTKACSSGGPGGVPSPDCPNPPTTGLCTPKAFCK